MENKVYINTVYSTDEIKLRDQIMLKMIGQLNLHDTQPETLKKAGRTLWDIADAILAERNTVVLLHLNENLQV